MTSSPISNTAAALNLASQDPRMLALAAGAPIDWALRVTSPHQVAAFQRGVQHCPGVESLYFTSPWQVEAFDQLSMLMSSTDPNSCPEAMHALKFKDSCQVAALRFLGDYKNLEALATDALKFTCLDDSNNVHPVNVGGETSDLDHSAVS